MLNPYFAIFIFILFITGFLLTMLFLSCYAGPKNVTKAKQIPFECGSEPVENVSDLRFNVRFYLIAVLFILFDIEVIFMYPWAVNLIELGWLGFFEVLTFMIVLLFGLAYVWKKGVLNWNDTI